jgi:protein-L-isoaspartate(D-aspartate) O-methyltransferase
MRWRRWNKEDYTNRRLTLLRELEARGISETRVLEAIANVPREVFLSEEYHEEAYLDIALPIDCDQTISQPYIVAYMTERLRIMPDSEVLEIGTGSGYQTAVLAQLASHVFTIERHARLHRKAVECFAGLGLKNITAILGDGMMGWRGRRSFDRILVAAASETAPEALLAQLRPCGSMIVPLGLPDKQELVLITRVDGHEERQHLLPVRFVPLLRGHSP